MKAQTRSTLLSAMRTPNPQARQTNTRPPMASRRPNPPLVAVKAATFQRGCCALQVANGVCQVLAKLGVIELGEGEFAALLPTLQEMVEKAVGLPNGAEDPLAVAAGRNALTCVAFLCEELADFLGDGDLPEDILAAENCNVVLTAAVNGQTP